MLENISPIDGRYGSQTQELVPYFSESALMRYRVKIELEYLIAFSKEKGIEELKPISPHEQKQLRSLYEFFDVKDAKRIKAIEEKTNHDVKAVEYFIVENIKKQKLSVNTNFVHFALTSEDVNNLAYSLMWQEALRKVYTAALQKVYQELAAFARLYKKQPLLALTHGQPATPTTVGKEFAVFESRLHRQMSQFKKHKLQGKLNGATGTWGAHVAAYPNVDWKRFSRQFVSSLGLEPNLVTTQIEPHDSLVESYHILSRINAILVDFCQDVWLYISRGILGQKKKQGEVGSSTMPHKINPINFENAEGNLGLANALLGHFAQKLPISRMQRDLSDSTVLRNQGVALSHALLACKSIIKGMERLTVNKQKLEEELNAHWEVLAEAIQTILRKTGYKTPYEALKHLTRGQEITKEALHAFIEKLAIPQAEKQMLLQLTPATYVGLAEGLV